MEPSKGPSIYINTTLVSCLVDSGREISILSLEMFYVKIYGIEFTWPIKPTMIETIKILV